MIILKSTAELSGWLRENQSRRRVLVPTMGALHDGHSSLFDLGVAHAAGGDVLATIFVNPTQFGPNEDFDSYPRQLEADLETCRAHGVTAVFAPAKEEMYFGDASISIHESSLSHRLCGASRPGHFDGVCTIVAKLFNSTQAHAAVFGEKDFQQLAVIRRMVRDLNFPIEIIPGPTVREPDGLAMSSRNAYLTKEQRQQAPVLFQALTEVAEAIQSGALTDPEKARIVIREKIERASGAKIDYVEVIDSDTLESLETFQQKSVRLLTATFFGKTRLIDNVGAVQNLVS